MNILVGLLHQQHQYRHSPQHRDRFERPRIVQQPQTMRAVFPLTLRSSPMRARCSPPFMNKTRDAEFSRAQVFAFRVRDAV